MSHWMALWFLATAFPQHEQGNLTAIEREKIRKDKKKKRKTYLIIADSKGQ